MCMYIYIYMYIIIYTYVYYSIHKSSLGQQANPFSEYHTNLANPPGALGRGRRRSCPLPSQSQGPLGRRGRGCCSPKPCARYGNDHEPLPSPSLTWNLAEGPRGKRKVVLRHLPIKFHVSGWEGMLN